MELTPTVAGLKQTGSAILDQKRAEALAALGAAETFAAVNVEVKATKNGNLGYRVMTSKGRQVTFWDSNMQDIVEFLDADTMQLKAGVRVLDDGSCIPAGSSFNLWK